MSDTTVNAYTLVFSSSSPFDTTLSAENSTDSQALYTVHSTQTMASTLVAHGREIGKIEHFSQPFGTDNVLLGEKNIRPSGLKTMGVGRHGSKVFEASDGVQYSWKLVQGDGWILRNHHTEELVATLKPYPSPAFNKYILSIFSPHREQLQDEIVLTAIYMEQRRMKHWDKGSSYQDDFHAAVGWKSKEVEKSTYTNSNATAGFDLERQHRNEVGEKAEAEANALR